MEFSLDNLCVGIGTYRVKKITTVSSEIHAIREILKKRNDSQGKIILLLLGSPNF